MLSPRPLRRSKAAPSPTRPACARLSLAVLLLALAVGGCDGRPPMGVDGGAGLDASARSHEGGFPWQGDGLAAGGAAQGDAGRPSGGSANGWSHPGAAPTDGGDDTSFPDAAGTDPNADAAWLDDRGAPIVILLIGDGYGAAQIDATRMFINGDTEPLSFERLPHQALVTTDNAAGGVTDSGASATAFATGRKVDPYVLSLALPGDGARLQTALEIQAARGKRTGLVTTHTSITDATPAAFGAHVANRFEESAVAQQLLTESRPNVLFGLSSLNINPTSAAAAGYTVVRTAAELDALDRDSETHVSGQFTEASVPPLQEMALAAIDLLDASNDGFFLLIETEESDTGGHASDLAKVLHAGVELEATVAAVLDWAKGRTDTLIIVGADHETGGLVLTEDDPTAGVIPRHTYTSNGAHTGTKVRFFATGPGAQAVDGDLDNTDFFPLLAGL